MDRIPLKPRVPGKGLGEVRKHRVEQFHIVEPEEMISVANYNLGGDGRGVSFSPCGNYIACVSAGAANRFALFKRVGDSVTKVDTYDLGNTGRGVSFSPCGNYIACVSAGSANRFALFKRVGDSVTKVDTYDLGGDGWGVSFSPCGNYIACVSAGSANRFALFKRVGDSVTKVDTYDLGTTGWGVSFSPDGMFVASADGANNLRLFKPALGEFETIEFDYYLKNWKCSKRGLLNKRYPEGKTINIPVKLYPSQGE